MIGPSRARTSAFMAALCCAALLTSCQSRGGTNHRDSALPGDFQYYVLSLSWAPAFCAAHGGGPPRECDPKRHIGFVVHGLWPELDYGKPLEFCRSVPPVTAAVVESALSLLPDRALIQHEWRAHGSCSGLTAREYFAAVRRATGKIKIPASFVRPTSSREMSPSEIEHQFAAASHFGSVPAIHIQCRNGELTEVHVCLGRDLEPEPCGQNRRDCASTRILVRATP